MLKYVMMDVGLLSEPVWRRLAVSSRRSLQLTSGIFLS